MKGAKKFTPGGNMCKVSKLAKGGKVPDMSQKEYDSTIKAFQDLQKPALKDGDSKTYNELLGAKRDYQSQNDEFERRHPEKNFAKGGGIHIKASNKGLLHKNLGVAKGQKIPAAKLAKAKESDSAAIRKRAVFAENAKSWNKK